MTGICSNHISSTRLGYLKQKEAAETERALIKEGSTHILCSSAAMTAHRSLELSQIVSRFCSLLSEYLNIHHLKSGRRGGVEKSFDFMSTYMHLKNLDPYAYNCCCMMSSTESLSSVLNCFTVRLLIGCHNAKWDGNVIIVFYFCLIRVILTQGILEVLEHSG